MKHGEQINKPTIKEENNGQPVKLALCHEMIPGIGWVPPGHPLHPDNTRTEEGGK